MKKMILLSAFIAILIFSITGLAAENPIELHISAAISLTDALQAIQGKYQTKNPNVKIIYNLGSSGALQTQIEQGAPADLFFSAAEKQMNALESKNLILKGSRKDLLENQLVLIIPKNSSLKLKDFNSLTSEKIKSIGIGAPESVPAGQYAQRSLKTIGIWDQLQSKMVFATNVRAVLTYVETGNVDAGIVYRTDTVVSNKVKIVASAPKGSLPSIIYPVAIIAGAKYPKEAKAFLNYLSSRESKAIFKQLEFVIHK